MVVGTPTHLDVCVRGDEVRRGFLGKNMKRKKVKSLFDHL